MWLRIIEARAREQREREGKLGKVRVPPPRVDSGHLGPCRLLKLPLPWCLPGMLDSGRLEWISNKIRGFISRDLETENRSPYSREKGVG